MRTRRKAKKGPIIITLLMLIALVFGSLYVFKEYFKKDKEEEKPIELNKEEASITYTTSFTVAGNILINSNMWKDTLVKNNVYDFTKVFKELKGNIKKSNINFYSEQSIIGGNTFGVSAYSNYNSPKEVGDSMTDIGFNMVSLANYHAYDKGLQGITNSINYWDEKEVAHSGTSINESDRLKNNTITKDGITYALLSYTMDTDTKYTDAYLVNKYSTELVKNDYKEVSKTADIVIVSIDWSEIKSNEVTTKQKEIATYLSELGVDVVIGNTGYSIQDIDKINNTLVFYSLGNLLSGHVAVDSRISAIVDFDLVLTKNKEEKTIEFKNINVMLTYAYNSNGANYEVLPFTKITNELKEYKTYYEKYKTELTKDKDYIKVYSLGE